MKSQALVLQFRDPVVIFTLGVALLGCTRTGVEPPPHVSVSTKLPYKRSTVAVPVFIDVGLLEKRLDEKLPQRLLTIDEDRDACVPAEWVDVCIFPKISIHGGCAQWLKTKITPAIDCHLSGHVDRGDVTIVPSGNVLNLAMPISASVTARGRGAIGKNIQETVSGAIQATAKITADVDENWQPVLQIEPDFTWRDRAYLRVLGIRITVGDKVEPVIRAAMGQIKKTAGDAAAELKLRPTAEKLWKDSFAPLAVNDNPGVWLRFQPQEVGFSGLSSVGKTVEMKVLASGITETFIGSRPPPAAPTPLPHLRKDLPEAGFNFYLPIVADYAAAATSLQQMLQVGKKQVYQVPNIGPVEVTFEKATIYPTSNDAVAVGLDLRADPPNQFFDSRGTIWIVGKVAVDNASKRLVPISLDYRAATDNPTTNLLVEIARLPPIRARINSALTYDFSKQFAMGLAKANMALNRDLGNDLSIQGSIDKATVDEIRASAGGVYMGMNVAGTLRVVTKSPLASSGYQ